MSWYCLKVTGKRERGAARRLKEAGYESYCPITRKDKGKKDEEKPNPENGIAYFPGYVFANLVEGRDDFHAVKQVQHVNAIVRLGDTYAKVPDEDIEFIKSMQDASGMIRTKFDHFEEGEKVRFREGHRFAMYEGFIKTSRKKRIYVLLEMMGKKQRIPVAPQDIEVIN